VRFYLLWSEQICFLQSDVGGQAAWFCILRTALVRLAQGVNKVWIGSAAGVDDLGLRLYLGQLKHLPARHGIIGSLES
jgi:hypothetical protein